MLKAHLIEAIADRFPDVHELVIEFHIARAYNQIIYQTFRLDPNNLDLYSKTYKDVAIVKDDDTNIYYSVLPAAIVQLPDVQDGVRRVSPMKTNDRVVFFPVPRDSWDVFETLDVQLTDDGIGYSVTNLRVEYDHKDSDVDTVKMDLVIDFAEYDEEDEVNIPSGQDAQLISIVEQFINGTPPPDKLND